MTNVLFEPSRMKNGRAVWSVDRRKQINKAGSEPFFLIYNYVKRLQFN